MNNLFVYVYYDNDTPFYVGMGKDKRHLDHIKYANRAIAKNAQRNKLSHKLNKIIKMLEENRLPEVKIVYNNLTIEQAQNYERKLITQYGRADLGLGPLTNMTNGGEGVHGRTTMISPDGTPVSVLKEDKAAYEAIGYHHFNKGRKHSDDVNKRKAGPWAGGTRPEHGDKIRLAAANGAYQTRPSRGAHSESTLEKMRAPKKKREGYQNKRWYHSLSLQLELCSNKQPDWSDIQFGRLPKPSYKLL